MTCTGSLRTHTEIGFNEELGESKIQLASKEVTAVIPVRYNGLEFGGNSGGGWVWLDSGYNLSNSENMNLKCTIDSSL